MNIRENNIAYFYQRENSFVCVIAGIEIGIIIKADDLEYAEIQAYLAEHPEALQDEPLPPPPSDAELEAQAEATRQAFFAENDKKALQYQREVRLGVAGAEEMLAAWDAYAEALRAVNDTEGWYKDPQWPEKPE
jgi:hypothetical protein